MKRRLGRRFALLTWVGVSLLSAIVGFAQDDAPTPVDNPAADNPAADEAPAAGEAAVKFAEKLQQWKDIIKSLRDLRPAFENAASAQEAEECRVKYNALLDQGRAIFPELRALGITAYLADPNADFRLARFLHFAVEDDVLHDAYEPAAELSQLLIEHEYSEQSIYTLAAIAAFATHDFEKAETHFQKARDENVLRKVGAHDLGQLETYVAVLDEYKEFWAKEQELRKAQAGQLPLVKFETTAGDMVCELFEKEAPETVANFIHLIEQQKFYDGREFHRVIPGFMAQTGRDEGGAPGYNIYCECYKPDYRKHFRGSLSMAKQQDPFTGATKRDSGGAQFYLTFLPTPHLNGVHTVFGRVVEGMDVLAKIERNAKDEEAPKNPDKIIRATVLKKDENKKYVPTKVKD